MAFSLPGFIIGRALAERREVQDPDRVNRVGIVAGLTGGSPGGGFSPVGLVVADQLARREAEEVPVPAPTPTDTIDGVRVQVPKGLIGKDVNAAKPLLDEVGLKTLKVEMVVSPEVRDIVIDVDPEEGEIVPANRTITLSVSSGIDPVVVIAGTDESIGSVIGRTTGALETVFKQSNFSGAIMNYASALALAINQSAEELKRQQHANVPQEAQQTVMSAARRAAETLNTLAQETTQRVAYPREEEEEANQEQPVTQAARRKAEELGVDLSHVQGTGQGGQIIQRDIITHASDTKAEDGENTHASDTKAEEGENNR